MTNMKTASAAGLWAAIATLLMLAAVEPVEVAPAETQVAAAATAQANG